MKNGSTGLTINRSYYPKFNETKLLGVLLERNPDETLKALNVSVNNRLDDPITFIFGPQAAGTVNITAAYPCALFTLRTLSLLYIVYLV